MSVLDIIFVIPIVWLAYMGFKNGLIIEVTTFVALLLGIYVSLYFSDITAEFLKEALELKTKYLSLISFVLTFILAVIAVNLLGKMISKLVDMAALGFINRSAGGLFGVLKAAIFLSFILFLIAKFDSKEVVLSQELRQESLFYRYIQPIAPEIIDIYGELDFSDLDPEELKNKVFNPDL